jgi:hypothetical protein
MSEKKMLPGDRIIKGAAEAAAFTGYKPGWVFQLVMARQIPHFKKGHRLLFLESELTAWLLSDRRKTQAELQAEKRPTR